MSHRLATARLDTQGDIAVITIDRPDALNAVSREVQRDLRDLLDLARTDSDILGVVFTGTGSRAFAAGADIKRLSNYARDTALASAMQRLFDEVERFEKPTVAAVNGFALGAGCELAMACDIRVAASSARFGLPETALGIIPGAGGTQRLIRLTGVGMALDLILTGRVLSSEEALSAGLVTRIVADEDLLKASIDLLQHVAARGPLAIELARLVIRTGSNVDQVSGQVVERLAQAVLYETQDKREGVAAFLEKRPADFHRR